MFDGDEFDDEIEDMDIDENESDDENIEDKAGEGEEEDIDTGASLEEEDEKHKAEETERSIKAEEFNRLKMMERLFLKEQRRREEEESKASQTTEQQKEDALLETLEKKFPSYSKEDLKTFLEISKMTTDQTSRGHVESLKMREAEAMLNNFVVSNNVSDEDRDKLAGAFHADENVRNLMVNGIITPKDMYDLIDAPRLRKQLAELKVKFENGENRKKNHGGTGGRKVGGKRTSKPLNEYTAQELENMSSDEFDRLQEQIGHV